MVSSGPTVRVPARSWKSIAAVFQSADVADDAALRPMARLIDALVAAGLTEHLYAFTSMFTLNIGQTDPIGYERIQVWMQDGQVHIAYREQPDRAAVWERSCAPDDAAATLRQLLVLNRWVGPDATR